MEKEKTILDEFKNGECVWIVDIDNFLKFNYNSDINKEDFRWNLKNENLKINNK